MSFKNVPFSKKINVDYKNMLLKGFLAIRIPQIMGITRKKLKIKKSWIGKSMFWSAMEREGGCKPTLRNLRSRNITHTHTLSLPHTFKTFEAGI